MNKIYIYDRKTFEILGVPFITSLEEFKKEPIKFFSNWDRNTMIAAETEVQYPIIDEITGFLRDKTREERILQNNEIELLEDGEYVENGSIVVVEYDESLNFYKKAWDKENHIYYEATTKDEFIEMRKNKILEYAKLEEEATALKNSKFSSEDEIKIVLEKMAMLEQEINSLVGNIETF